MINENKNTTLTNKNRMKILFIHNLFAEYLGLMHLSAVVKEDGHNCEVAVGKDYRKHIFPSIKKSRPDIVGISIMTFSHNWGLWIARSIKDDFPYIKIIFGGPHCTYFSDFIEEDGVDIMVSGEGEYAFKELVHALSNGESITSIQNVSCKIDGKIYRNPPRPLIKDLDKLIFPDRELYKPYSLRVGRKDAQTVFTTRGCPFKCTYCYNNAAEEYYGKQAKYVRTRSIENIIQEIEYIRKVVKPRKLCIEDDSFGWQGIKWIYEFLEVYSKRVKYPFMCNMRANLLASHPQLARRLKKAGCFLVCFGIETGNEYLRNEVIKKGVKDMDIIQASDHLHKEGIYIRTCNILGFPRETLDNLYETIAFNQKIKADFPVPYIFYPFPKTGLAELALQDGLLKENSYKDRDKQISSFHDASVLELKHKLEVKNLHKLFLLAVSYPFLTPLIKKMARYKLDGLYRLIFNIMLWLKFKKTYRLTLPRAIINFFR